MEIGTAYKKMLILSMSLFIVLLGYTCYKYPITKAYSTIESSNQWLTTTIADYYLETLAFSTIILMNEDNLINALCWIISNCVFGSPVAVTYVLYNFSDLKKKLSK